MIRRCVGSRRLARTSIGGLIAVSVGLGAATARADGYRIGALALDGDPAPGGGLVQGPFYHVSIDDSGRVVFLGYRTDGPVTEETIFEHAGGLARVAAAGDPAPVPGGATFTGFPSAEASVPDGTAFVASYDDGGGGGSGLFADGAGTTNALVLSGQPAPGGDSTDSVEQVHHVAGPLSLTFSARIATGQPLPVDAQLVVTPAGVQEVFREGDPSPVGGSFSGVEPFHRTGVAADGSVAFGAEISGAVAPQGLFRWAAGTITPLRLVGDVLTSTPGGTYAFIDPSVTVAADGDIAIQADVLRPGAALARDGIYVLTPGVGEREIVYHGDPVPGTSPPLFFGGVAGGTPPEIDADGDVAFTAVLTDAAEEPVAEAVLVSAGGSLRVVALSGDPVPRRPGEAFQFFPAARIDAAGRVVFEASSDAGTQGVFLATPVAMLPGLGPGGLGLLVAALLVTAALARARG